MEQGWGSDSIPHSIWSSSSSVRVQPPKSGNKRTVVVSMRSMIQHKVEIGCSKYKCASKNNGLVGRYCECESLTATLKASRIGMQLDQMAGRSSPGWIEGRTSWNKH